MTVHTYMYKVRHTLAAACCLGALTVASCTQEPDPFEAAGGAPIATPTVQLSRATYRSLSFSWSGVEGATQYGYKLISQAGQAVQGSVTTATLVAFDSLEANTPYTLEVVAYPAVTASRSASAVQRLAASTTLLVATGTFSSALLGSEWEATLTETSDNTYTLTAWYGAEGYDLQFTVDANGSIQVLNAASTDEAGHKVVPTGRTGIKVKNGVAIDEAGSYFDRFEGLILSVWPTRGNVGGVDTFTWTWAGA